MCFVSINQFATRSRSFSKTDIPATKGSFCTNWTKCGQVYRVHLGLFSDTIVYTESREYQQWLFWRPITLKTCPIITSSKAQFWIAPDISELPGTVLWTQVSLPLYCLLSRVVTCVAQHSLVLHSPILFLSVPLNTFLSAVFRCPFWVLHSTVSFRNMDVM